jgi:fibronectin-binding autotransporter adhesin
VLSVRLLCTSSLSALALLALPSVAYAQDADRNWDANSTAPGNGGTGTWSTTADPANRTWSPNTDGVSGPYATPWDNSLLDNAIFGGTAGTVTLGTPITVHNIIFNTANYTIIGNTLTLAGVTPTITVNSGTSTIDSILAGTNGITKVGAGTLSLTGANTFTGGVVVNAGGLSVGSDGALGNGNTVTLNDGTSFAATGALSTSRQVILNGAVEFSGAGVGSALVTGTGTLSLFRGVVMSNDANSYTGTTITNAPGTAGTVAFTSVRNTGIASSLGASGEILLRGINNYIGDGDTSNRTFRLQPSSNAAVTLANRGTGTLALTGAIFLEGGPRGINFDASSADLNLSGTLSGTNTAVVTYTGGGTARTITLGGANTYSGRNNIGPVTLAISTLADRGVASSLGTNDNTGAGFADIRIDSGVLDYRGGGDSSNRTWEIVNNASLLNNGSGGLTLTGAAQFNIGAGLDTLTLGGSSTSQNTLSGALTGSGSVVMNGSGTWVLSGSNSYTGTTTIESGTLRAGSATAFNQFSSLTVNGGTFDLDSYDYSFTRLDGTGGTIALGSGNLTINAATGVNPSFAGSITGTGSLTKLAGGTLTLTGASTYTGATTIGGGTLALDFSPASGPTSNILSGASALSMGGGTLTITGAAGEANSQSFNGLTITGGNNTIIANSGGATSLTLNLGVISRTGGLANFVLPTAGAITTTNGAGALGGWATVNGTDYAKVVAGNIVAFTDADYTDQDDASLWANGQFISDSDGDAESFFGTVGSSVQLGGLQFTTPDATTTVTIAGGQTLGVDGTIIVAPSVLGNSQTITGGNLTGTSGGGVLGVQQNSTGTFTIASQIVDNTGTVGFTKSGSGRVVLTGSNSYTGATTVAQGTLSVNSIENGSVASAVGASTSDASNLVIQGATLEYTGGTTTSDRGFTLARSGAATSGTISVTNAATNLTFGGQVTSSDGAGLTKIGNGTLTLTNAGNDYTGVTTISDGMLSISSIGNGGAASTLGASSSDSANLVLQTGGELEYTGGTAGTDRGFTLNGVAGGAIDVVNAGTALTFSGTVQANGIAPMRKEGAGTLVLAGTNTYTGATIINGGKLQAGATQAFGISSAVTLADAAGVTLDLAGFNNKVGGLSGGGASGGTVLLGGATLTLGGYNVSFNGTITGSGGLTKENTSNQAMIGCNNNYTGITTLLGGTLSVDCLADGGLASGIGASSNASSNLVFNGGTLAYTGASVSIDRGFTLLGNGAIDVSDAAAVLEFEGIVAGTRGFSKSGPGTLVLSGANSYTGDTRVMGGVLRAGADNAFGPQGHMTLDDTAGVLLDLNDHAVVVTSLIGGGANGGNVDLGSGTLTFSAVDARSYAGAISGTGNLVMTANNAARVQELTSCSSNYDGTTTVSSGVLAINCLNNGGLASSIGDSGAAASNLVLNGGTLRYIGAGGNTDRLFALGSSANSKIEASGTGALAFTNTGAIAFSSPNTAQTIRLGGTNTANNSFALQITDNGSGVTSFTKEDAGTWILTNTGSTYTGVTSILGGVLGVDKLADGGQASSIGRSSLDATNLVIGSGSTLRYTGGGDSTNRLFTLQTGVSFIESSGTGAIAFANTGTMGFQGSGARILALGGTNTGANIMGVSITDGTGGATTVAKNDNGSWHLTGNSTYTGPTTINAGTLFIGNGGTTGSITSNTVNVTGLGALGFNRSDAVTYAGTIQGSGGVTQAGTGTTVLTGTNSYTGGTTISAGTLQLGGGGATGSISGNVTNNSTLAFNRNNAYAFAGVISGMGRVTQVGSGTTTLTGTNTYSGGTAINAGTLQVSSDTNLGAASGGLSFNGGTLNSTASFSSTRATSLIGAGTFLTDPSTTLTLSGLVSGAGSLTKTGTGTLTLTANNDYTGLTTISAGTLQVGNGGGTGAIVGNVVNNGTLTFNRTGTLGYAGAISGSGPVNLIGGATYSFTGDSTYSGATTVTGDLRLVGGGSIVSTSSVTTQGATQAITVSGAGSALSTGSLLMGSTSPNGTPVLTIDNGGVVTVTGDARLGNQTFTTSVTLNMQGAGSLLDVGGTLFVAQPNSSLAANVTGGATIRSGAAVIGTTINSGATKQFTLSGAGTTWTNTNGLTLNSGNVSVLNGAQLATGSGTIGGFLSTARVLVSGVGSTFSSFGALSVGGANSTNASITLTDGGRLSVGGSFALANGSGSTGILNIGGAEGQAAAAAGMLDAATLAFGGGTGELVFNHTDVDYRFGTAVSGAGTIRQIAGDTNLTGNSAGFAGTTIVTGGALRVNGTLGDATSTVNVQTGGRLGGAGTIGGNVNVTDGVLAPGNSPGVLTIAGNLSLTGASLLDFEFGQANVPGGPLNDLIEVGGDLTLDGTINVTQSAGGSFGPGVYRIINYAGMLTDNGLTVGGLPSGTGFVQTAIANQVNLVNTAGLTLNYWDGAAGPKNDSTIQGGNGTWRLGGGENNWTEINGAVNADYAQDSFAIFQGSGGTVAVDNSGGNVSAAGMQFTANGYTVAGGPLALSGTQAFVRVGDGGGADAALTATIDATLTGSAQLVKTDGGTLVLTSANSYTGGTAINGGTLRIASDANLGDAAGGLSFNGGTLHTTAGLTTARNIALAGAGTFETDAGTLLTLNGVVSGGGSLIKDGAGLMVLTAANTYAGGTTVNSGILQVGNGTTGSILGDVVNNAQIAFARSDDIVFAGTISGGGSLSQLGAGMLTLAADNSYTGTTTISSVNAGTLQLGNGGATGSILGDVINGGTLIFNRSNEYSFAGTISGAGDVRQEGTGTTILTADNSYTGSTVISRGTLLINGNQTAAIGGTHVLGGGTLGGIGTIGGDVFVGGAATLTPGDATGPGTLTINGNLGFSPNAVLAYEFGQSNIVGGPLNDLTQVGGNLTLDGTIDVTVSPGGSFGPGLYRVISYGGALTNDGLNVGTMPAGSTVAVQTSIGGQVNLVNAAGATFNFWDGAASANESNNSVDGGSGIWQNSSGNNDWTTTDGAVSGAYTDGAFAIFAAAAGTVEIDNSLGAVTASGLQFASDGYTITGQDLTLVGPQSIIRVGDGTAAGLGMTATIDAALIGATQLVKADLGTLVLTGTNSYTGGTLIDAGTLRIASDANLGDAASALTLDGGTLNTTADIVSARDVTLTGTGTFVTDAGTTLAFTGALTGAGDLIKDGAGALALNDVSSHSGATTVRAGSLFINGDLSLATGLTSVASGATLGGSGVIGGNVAIADGAILAAGTNGVGTLTINGNLALAGGSVLDFEFGEANVAGGSLNDLVEIGGNLTLDGTINVTVPASGSFGPGIYRVFNYGGALTDNGLALGAMPGGSTVSVQTAVAGQVNLVNTAGLTLSFWDGDAGPKNNGVVNGGNGVWRAAGGLNDWTDSNGALNADYAQDSFAVFAGAPGTVTIDDVDGAVRASGMQFASDGYTITGDALTLTGTQAIVQVGDGSAAGASYAATIASELTGAAGLVKTDAGRLILTGANNYTGGTTIDGGTLQIGNGGATGSITGDIVNNAALVVNRTGTLTLDGTISGSGSLTKTGSGTLILGGTNSYVGGTAINGGTLQVSSDANLGNAAGGLSFNGGTLDITTTLGSNRAVNLVGTGTFLTQGTALNLRGLVSGGGAVVKDGNGSLTLTADNDYTGGTTINAGLLSLGDGGTTGSILGNIVNNSRFAINRSNIYTLTGTISGSGDVLNTGTGTTILTAANDYTGVTQVSTGMLLVNGNQSAATGLTSVASGATLGGIGTIGGDVVVADGATLAPGAGGAGALTINGGLSLGSGSSLAFEFGRANAPGDPLNDAVNVGGDLTLDGTLNVAVTPGGAFDIGLYRIASYAGALTNNGLAIGAMPAGAELSVQTSIVGQVNLVNTGSAVLNFWDGNTGPKFNGAVDGGSGVWWATGTNNWTDATGAVNASYDNGAFAIFAGRSGLVTIDNSQGAVTASGLQIAASGGYVIQGGALTLTGPQSVIRVGDGTTAGIGYSATITSGIIGNTQLVKTDLGRLVLAGVNSYTGGTAVNGGTLRISSDANLGAASGGLSFNGGTLNTTADLTSARTVDLAGQGVFSTDAGTTLTLTGNLTGTGLIGKLGAGTLVLAGTGSHTGGMGVVQGTLLVNGDYAAATGLVTMNPVATLGGTGTIGGNVNLSGTLAPGAGGVGTLTINGNLGLSQTATLAYEFGQANVAGGALNDLVNVGGNLTLDGTINVTVPTGGAFDVGVYRVFNYGGTLTNNGLTLGAMPGGSNVAVQTSIAGQVNLVNSAGLSLGFWDGAAGPKNDGAINGGSGIWQNSGGNDNWADASGKVNAAYSDGAFAVFGGTGGTVTVDNSLGQVSAGGMQFAANGYTLTGGSIALTGSQSTIRVGDGSTAGAGFTATINAALTGDTQLLKTDAGTLVLGGINSYTGGTAINGGTLQISADANLGAANGDVTLDGGTLATSANVTSNRTVALAGAGTFSAASGTTFTLGGTLSGPGALTKTGAGTLLLTGDNNGYTGATTVSAGTLAVTGELGGAVTINGGGRLAGNGSVGSITNTGTVAPGVDGFGTLSVIGSYAGSGGTLEIETALGGDASQTDRLVAAGGTSGTTALTVINRGGLGAQTVEGIKIVDVTGGTSAGTFTLNGDYVFNGDQALIAGAYGYRLYKNGVSAPTDGDWYLRSSLLDAPTPNTPNLPLFQPGVPVYEAYGQTLLTLTDVGTLQQRIGTRQWAQTGSGEASGIWGRMQASRSRPNAVRSTSLSDVNVDSWKLELGADHVLSERSDGASLILGVIGGYGEANANIASIYGGGTIKAKSYSAGATLSWFGPAGFYVDGRAQVSWFDSKLKSAVLGTLADGNGGTGQAYSVELGKRTPVGQTLSITPQIQMSYQTVGFDTFIDSRGAEVSSRLGDSLKARWGLSVDRQDARSRLYSVVNLSYEWLDGTITHVSGTPIARENHRLWGEVGLGGSVLLADRLTLYSEVSGNTALNDFGESYSLKATAGLRLAF